MTRFNTMVLRMLPAPFLGWLAALMFLLLMQFLIKHMPDLVGKGLPPGAVIELIAYSLAYMLVLAVPMSVLIATLSVFGRLGESRAYAVMKSAGLSFVQVAWPAFVIGALLVAGMTYFNTVVLPESNFRAKVLWQDIREKQPGFVLEPGVFYEGVAEYAILVRVIDPATGALEDVTIFDYTDGPTRRAEIKAASGSIETRENGSRVVLTLRDGELHRLEPARRDDPETYERIRFARHVLGFSLDDLQFSRTDPSRGRRSDRTMRTSEMAALVDSLRASVSKTRAEILRQGPRRSTFGDLDVTDSVAGRDTATRLAVVDLDLATRRTVYDDAMASARLHGDAIEDGRRTIEWRTREISRYRVEIHKKYSIALACLVFVLVGAPLGLSFKRSSLAFTGAVATGIFVFYWVTLVWGEKLADRGLLAPGVGMWAANVATVVGAVVLIAYVALDLHATPRIRRRLKDRSSRH